jgi:hypothetical protein
VRCSQSSTAISYTYSNILKNVFTYQEVNGNFLLACFAESNDKVVEKLASKEHLTYHKAMKAIVNLDLNHLSTSEDSSKYSNPQHEVNPISLSNRMKDKKKSNGSSSFSNSGSTECTWYPSTLQAVPPFIFGYPVNSSKD